VVPPAGEYGGTQEIAGTVPWSALPGTALIATFARSARLRWRAQTAAQITEMSCASRTSGRAMGDNAQAGGSSQRGTAIDRVGGNLVFMPTIALTRRRRLAAAVVLCAVLTYLTRGWWAAALGQSLICAEGTATADAVVLDNLDNEFGLFRRAAELQRTREASRVLVPVATSYEEDASFAAQEAVRAFARAAGLSDMEIIPVQIEEPISLNAAYQVRDVLVKERVRSISLLSPAFRSKRSELVYRAVLADQGITINCSPVPSRINPQAWTRTWHGIQDVVLQFSKLQYYRLWVLPWSGKRAQV
jgi:hypothetical protein